jgi:hypothetical protein
LNPTTAIPIKVNYLASEMVRAVPHKTWELMAADSFHQLHKLTAVLKGQELRWLVEAQTLLRQPNSNFNLTKVMYREFVRE